MTQKWIFRFEKLGQEHSDLVGRKCANLGEMTKMGLPVPPGFALTVDAYSRFLAQTNAAQEIQQHLNKVGIPQGVEQFEQVSRALRQIVESQKMPEDMEETIVSYYDALCQRCGVSDVAVSTRSAGPVSHPGQYETYLNVRGKSELIENIIRVWASTFNTRSLMARARQNLPLGSDHIGVAVLKMVNARCSGVTFTADPDTGNRSLMIYEANWGLGESVVSGSVAADTYILDKESLEVLEKTLGQKTKQVISRERGVVEEDVPPDKSSIFCLSDEETREIGRLAKTLEAHFGLPQDVEWAVDSDLPPPQNIVLLQARPAIIAEEKSPIDQMLDVMSSFLFRR